MIRWTVARKVLGLALLNLLVVAAALLLVALLQFHVAPESLLFGPVRDRIQAIAGEFSWEFDTEPEVHSEMLDRYSQRYDARFLLVRPDGSPVLGPAVILPPEVLERLRTGGPEAPPPRRNDRGKKGKGGDRKGKRPPRPGEPPPPWPEDGPPSPEGLRSPPRRENAPPGERSFMVIAGDPSGYWAGVRIPLNPRGQETGQPGVLLIRSDTIFNSKLFFDWRLGVAGTLGLIALSAAVWLPFLRGLTGDVTKMDHATEQIAEGHFAVELPRGRNDEVGHLAEQITRMASRLETFVTSQKRFLGDIAHELCGPIARVQFALGILEQRAADEQQPYVARLRVEIQEMSVLVNELLSLSKAGMQPGAAELGPVEVAGAVERALEREAVSGEAVRLALEPGLVALANEAHVVRAVSNLIRNAVRYAGQAGPIEITSRGEDAEAVIVVADRGPGLPPEAMERVFEPFFRVEESRSRETGGVGLGLAIVKSCVVACGGSVSCRNRKPSGLEVAVRLPRFSAE